MRYFCADAAVSQAVRASVMAAMSQPNGQAAEPWGENGDFLRDGKVYLALSPHQTEGEFWSPLIAAALDAGVDEVTAAQYVAARPASPSGDL